MTVVSSTKENSVPVFVKEAWQLVQLVKRLSARELEELMKINTKLAWLDQERFAVWRPEFTAANANQALFSFKGEVYHGLDAPSLPSTDVEYAQHHLRILSGLYGVLRPLDLIQPYRLEMETSIRIGKHDNLYHFWKQKITRQIASDLRASGSNLLINLASLEYSSAIDLKKVKANIVAPQFLESRNDSYQMITVYAKKARGMMARFVIEYRINCEEDLRGFSSEGYCFNSHLSKSGSPVFTR
jgi:uncharacterized protein